MRSRCISPARVWSFPSISRGARNIHRPLLNLSLLSRPSRPTRGELHLSFYHRSTTLRSFGSALFVEYPTYFPGCLPDIDAGLMVKLEQETEHTQWNRCGRKARAQRFFFLVAVLIKIITCFLLHSSIVLVREL